MRTALIIGAAGQDGQLLASQLLARGYAVHGWVRSIASCDLDVGCSAVDLLDAAAVCAALHDLHPAEVYYLAAFHHSAEDAVQLSPAELLRRSNEVHVDGLVNVLEAIKAFQPTARLFYAASSHVFGDAVAESQNEQTPFRPHSAYGVSKAAGLQCCRSFREQGVFAAAGILFNHESPLRKPSFLSQKIVQGALRAQQDPSYKLLLGDLDAEVDWGYAPDYVDAMWRILQLAEPGEFVVASGETHTVREFAQIAYAVLGLDWRVHVSTDPSLLKKSGRFLCGNAQKLRAATGWAPTVAFAGMVRKLVSAAEARRRRLLLDREGGGIARAFDFDHAEAPRAATC